MSYLADITTDAPVVFFENEEASGTPMVAAIGSNGTYAGGINYRQPGPLAYETSYGVLLNGSTGTGSVSLAGDTPTYPFCLELWVNPASVSDNDRLVHIADAGAGDTAFIGVGTGGTVWQIGYEGSGNTRTKEGGTVGSGWQHLFARFVSATERRLYHNGELIATDTASAPAWTGASYTLYVGSNAGSSNFLNATVSRIAYYNTDVTPARLQTHWLHGVSESGDVDALFSSGPTVGFHLEVGPTVGFTLEN